MHTPGPWKIMPEKNEEYGTDLSDGIDLYVGHEKDTLSIGRIEHSCLAFGEDNARLIAAAPDLLEACVLAKDFIDNERSDISVYKMIEILEKAISKAEGRK